MSGSNTVRDAAVKLLIGDMHELVAALDRGRSDMQELQQTQKLCHIELDADLQQLGSIVQTIQTDASKASEAGRAIAAACQRLENAATRIESATAAPAVRLGATSRARRPIGKATVLATAVAALALLWAAIASYALLEQRQAVQAGRATLKAWPALDAGARKTIQAAGSQ